MEISPVKLPSSLQESIARDASAEWRGWADRLETRLETVCERWGIELEEPYAGATCAFVAPVRGRPLVLKLGIPHMEAEHEADALALWDGRGAVRLVDLDPGSCAMLLERCEPGTCLRDLDEATQDGVIASLLRTLWSVGSLAPPFRPLSEMTAAWTREVLAREAHWPDRALVSEALELYRTLPRTDDQALLATDLHAGNVLRAGRAPWLAIDPKPFVGDRAFDATQHLLNCRARLSREPARIIDELARRIDVAPERLRLWTFARVVLFVESWEDPGALQLAHRLRP